MVVHFTISRQYNMIVTVSASKIHKCISRKVVVIGHTTRHNNII